MSVFPVDSLLYLSFICRFVVPVYPSVDQDDVITSPYNSVLAMHQLTEHADVILPIENSSLERLVNSVSNKLTSQSAGDIGRSSGSEVSGKIKTESAITKNTGELAKQFPRQYNMCMLTRWI